MGIGGEALRHHQIQPGQAKLEGHEETPQAVTGAAGKIDRRGLFEIFGRATDLGDGVAVPNNLGEHLVVKNEIVRVGIQGQYEKELT